jgi:hypothetical protein
MRFIEQTLYLCHRKTIHFQKSIKITSDEYSNFIGNPRCRNHDNRL